MGLQNDEIWTWHFFQQGKNWSLSSREVPLMLEGLAVGGMVSALCHHAVPEPRCPSVLVNRHKDLAAMLQPRRVGRGDLSNHTNDFFPPAYFYFFSWFCFPLWYLNLIFYYFFYSKALFIYLMYTAKLGEKGSWDYFFFLDLLYVNCSVYTSGIIAWYKAVPA